MHFMVLGACMHLKKTHDNLARQTTECYIGKGINTLHNILGYHKDKKASDQSHHYSVVTAMHIH